MCSIAFCFGTRVRSLLDALRIATPKKRLPGAGGGFLTSSHSIRPFFGLTLTVGFCSLNCSAMPPAPLVNAKMIALGISSMLC